MNDPDPDPEQDPDPDPYLWPVDPDPDPGGPEHVDPMDPYPDSDPDPQHWFEHWSGSTDLELFVFYGTGTSSGSMCAADFSLLNLPKGKSLGRSKPATNS